MNRQLSLFTDLELEEAKRERYQEGALQGIREERRRQIALINRAKEAGEDWRHFNETTDDNYKWDVLSEEVEEVWRAAWKADWEELQEELIQVAAVCVAWIEALEQGVHS